MSESAVTSEATAGHHDAERTALVVLAGLGFCHMLNDMQQSLLPALYPILKTEYALDFGQIGLITLAFQITASLLQPLIGIATDRRPQPFALPVGMGCTLLGLLLLAWADSFALLLVAAAMVGTGSAVFHPESSRIARLASGGRHGLAQSMFQVGGNIGAAIGPLAAAFIILPRGQHSIVWFCAAALVAMLVLFRVSQWYQAHRRASARRPRAPMAPTGLSRAQVSRAFAILLALMFSKFFYLASIGSYYTFYLIDRFGVSVQTAQILLFVFLGASAVGTFAGGPIGDRIGRKAVIWVSILGALPFTLALPWVDLFWTVVLSVPIGVIIASAFSAIVVYGQELVPGKVGAVSGLFFGLAFGMGGIAAAALGELADLTSIEFVYEVCAFLPAIGLLTAFLPTVRRARAPARA